MEKPGAHENRAYAFPTRLQATATERRPDCHPADACTTCGATTGEGGKALLLCSRCQNRRYCSQKCQKAHRYMHKKVCPSPTESDASSVKKGDKDGHEAMAD